MNQESRKWIFMTAGAALSAGLSAWGVRRLYSQFREQREETFQELVRNSQVFATASGPVEASIHGSGPPILMVHGAAGGYDQGNIEADAFEGYTIISVSRPGYLRTPLSSGPTPSDQADAMTALLDALHIHETVYIGTSTGGLVGLYFALRHPERCKALVLISTVNASLPVKVSPLAVFSPILSGDFLSWALFRAQILLRIRPDLHKQLASQPEKIQILDQLLQTAYPTSFRLSGMLNDATQIDQLGQIPLEQVQVPTLVIHGTRDEVVPFQQGVRSASRIPGARFLPVPQGTHYCALTHLELVFPAIKQFIAQYQQNSP